MCIENLAYVSVQVTEVYINEEIYALRETITIASNEVETVYLFGVYVIGNTYFVKVFSGLSQPIVFSVECDEIWVFVKNRMRGFTVASLLCVSFQVFSLLLVLPSAQAVPLSSLPFRL
jgi:hypothetical protein